MDVTLRRARSEEVELLAAISRRAFESDGELGTPDPGGPPGHADPQWHLRTMGRSLYLSVLIDGAVIGGVIIRRIRDDLELTRLFIDSDQQRRGIGTRVMGLLSEVYPDTDRWTLETPASDPRARTFVEQLGFVEYGRRLIAGDIEFVRYERYTE